MGQLNGQQQDLVINVNSVDKLLYQSSPTNQCNNQKDLPSISVIPLSTSTSSSGQPKVRSKWRPEIPEINWQDCFCICFFFYLLFSDTESEKRRKAEKKAEKEIVRRRKKILLEQEREKKRRIKEMVKERERDDGGKVGGGGGGEKKVTSKRKNDAKEGEILVSKMKSVDQSKRVLVKNGKSKDEETINGNNGNSANNPTKRIENGEMRIEKRSTNCDQQSTIKQMSPRENKPDLNKINNLDSSNHLIKHQTSTNTVIVNWNDLN